ncbi:TetR family transcriptional regulator [Nakamurella sp. YIM 132087]|uniref:TetR family transcriptional regulator n=1 Tax=Nakamurella alba TaxID=2665158 RepID=A0A7K1FK87_9ACTN|nr:TetR/AcrR family transcriptional regulator [Nakamurella alba]MTD14555.1 TetR family transcriptional regulator [Nakamurella alba]
MTAPRPSAARTARERARASLTADLLDTARRHMAELGAPGLSLRAVARDLGLASSAVYRYVKSRDELITLLIVDAYESVATVAEQADLAGAAAGADAGERWLGVCRAVRGWAHERPHEYALIYGSPIPGYQAPRETVSMAVRLWRVIIGIVDAAIAAGTLRPPRRQFAVDGLLTPETLVVAGRPGPPFSDAVVRAGALFTSMIGSVSADLFGHLRGMAHDGDRLFDYLIATAAEGVGLDVPVPTV